MDLQIDGVTPAFAEMFQKADYKIRTRMLVQMMNTWLESPEGPTWSYSEPVVSIDPEERDGEQS